MFCVRLLIISFIFFLSASVSALDLTEQKSVFPYILEVLPDSNNELTCENIYSTPHSDWKTLSSEKLHLGFSTHPYWLRIKAINLSSINSNRFILFQHDLLESVERCVKSNIPQKAGINIPFTEWPLKVSVPAFKIRTDEVEEYTYFKIESRSILNFNLKVFDLPGYLSFLHQRQSFQYALLVFGAIVTLLYFLFFLLRKEIIYFYFSLLASGTGLSFYILYGDGYMYFWPDSPELHLTGIKASSTFTSLLSTLFGRHLLSSWMLPKIERCFQGMLGLSLFHFIISFIPGMHELYEFLLMTVGFVGISIVFYASLIQYRRKHYFVKFYLMGWVLVLISFILSVLASTGMKPYHDYLYYAPVMAYPFGMMFFMVGSYRWVAAKSVEMKLIQERHDRMLEKFNSLEAGEVINSRTQLAGVDVNKSLQLLSRLMQEEKLYELEDLRLETLAKSMNLRPHQLSELLNKELQVSFTNFVQKFRVEAAKKLLADPDNSDSILDIGLSVGFGSKTSFNRSFVRMEGMPPGQYSKLVNKVLH